MNFKPLMGTVLTAALAFSSFVACSSGGAATGSTCPTTQTLTYDNFGQAFMTKYCTSCHGGKESPSLSTLASIQAHISDIDKEAAAGPDATNTSMPEGSTTPSDAERKQLGEWLACGAP
jgi:hypothetical protein